MTSQVATNVRLDPEQLKQLKQDALNRGMSLSRLFREIVSEYLQRSRPLSGEDWNKDPFFQIGQNPGSSGRADGSEEHDRDLYGTGEESS